jgi:hypothetical protein
MNVTPTNVTKTDKYPCGQPFLTKIQKMVGRKAIAR